MIVNVMTNNYQERHEDKSQRIKELESQLSIEKMDRQEAEEMLETAYDKIKKLEGEVRRLKVENGKLKQKKEDDILEEKEKQIAREINE